jgi:Domain of unknown function (DUF4349)
MNPTSSSTSLTVPAPSPTTSRRVALGALVLVLGLAGASGLAATIGSGTTGGGTTGTGAAQPSLDRAAPGYGAADHAAAGMTLPPAAADQRGVFSSAALPANSAAKSLQTAAPAPTSAGASQAPRIEETGGITLVVPGAQVQPDLSRVATLAVASGGFVASTQTQSSSPGSPAQGTITLQVPEASFNTVLSEVRGLGRVATLTTSATDVTGQYVDLQARITALQDSRQQYLTIMAKATTVGGILAVQEQLQNLQSQLEQLQGQLQLLDNETTYATLAVTLSQKVVTPPPPRPEPGLLKAWNAAVGGFVAGFEGVVRVAGPLFFSLLLLAALVLVGRWAWRFRPRRAHPPAPEPK